MMPRFVLPLVLMLFTFPALPAQTPVNPGEDTTAANRPGGTYCNVFYVTSYDTEVLPFNDVCFVVDEYSMGSAKTFRCIGPIKGTIDLFRSYPWSIRFHMPYVAEGDRLEVMIPEDLNNPNLDMAPGKFFVTLAEVHSKEEQANALTAVDFAAVKGKATVTEYTPMQGEMSFPEYTAQIDMYFQQVDHSGEKPVMVGPQVRVKMVLRVEALD